MVGAPMLYGTPGHTARVEVPSRTHSRLERLVLPREDGSGAPLHLPGAPLGIVADPTGRVLVVQFVGMLVLVVPYGARAVSGSPRSLRMIAATSRGLVWGDELYGWDDEQPPATLDGVGYLDEVGAQLGLHLGDDGALTTVTQVSPAFAAPQVVVRCVTHQTPGRGLRTRYRIKLPGYGTGAIDDKGRPVVAMEDGTVLVYRADAPDPGDAERRPKEHLRLRRAPAPYAISTPRSGLALVSARTDHDGTTPSTERELRRLLDPRLSYRGRWRSRVERLDDSGATRWTTTVDFGVYQPPVDGGGDRLYLVGRGVAALDGDTLAWSWPAPSRLHGAAFADGGLAVCGGPDLRVLDRDGKTITALTTPDAEPICTPPAILEDGAIAFGTPTRIYVAR